MADNNLQQDPLSRLYGNIKNSYDLPDFSTFKADMSDSNKAKKLHETLVKDGYDMPAFDVFSTDMGLKKKDLGGPISSPTGSQSVSKSFISSLPEQKSIYAPSEKFTSESTVVVQPKEAKLISEANKRGDQITKEAIENSNDLYLKMQNKFGNKVTKETPYIVQNKKELEGDLKNGTLQVVKSPKTGKYVLAHKADIFDSFSKAWDNVLAKQADDRYVASLTPEEKIKHYEAKEALNQDKYLEQAPSGFSGSVGRILGENAEPLIKLGAMGTAAGKAAQAFGASASTIANAQRFGSFLAFATDAGYSGYADNTERVYKSLREQDPNGDKVEQMKKAENAGLIGEASGIGMAAAMSGMFSNLKGAAKTINTKPFVSALETMAKHTAKEGAVQGSVAALNSIVSDLGAKSQGLKIDTGDILTNALDAGSSMAQFVAINSLAMGAATGLLKLPGYVKAQAKGLVSDLPREEVKAVYESAESNGILPEGTTDKVINSLNEYDKAKQKLPEGISDEHKAALTGIQEKIDKLEKSKEKLAPQYHARVDDTINSLKDRAVKILDSKNPMAEEVDNILNVKGSEEIAGPPVTETDLIEEVKPKVEATEKEVPVEVKTTEEIAPTEVKVTEEVKPAEVKPLGEKVTVKLLSSEEPPQKEGQTIVTLSGKTEAERLASIEKRQSSTKVSDKVLADNALIQKAQSYFNKGKNYKNSPEGRAELNKLRFEARDLGLTVDTERNKVTVPSKKTGRPRKVSYDNRADSDRVIESSGKTLTERNRNVQEVFEELTDAGVFLDIKSESGNRMNASQIDAAINDILEGIPSKGANKYLDALEKGLSEDAIPLYDKGMGGFAPRLTDIRSQLGVEKEVIGEPMDEAAFNKFLDEESKLTPEEEQDLLDNVENLLYEYETTEEGPQGKVQPIEARTEEGVSGKAEPIAEVKKAGKVAEPVKEAPKEKIEEQPYKDLTRNEKRRIINSKFEELLTNEDFYKKFKIKSKCL